MACTAGLSSQAELQTLPNWDVTNRDCPTEVSRPNEVSRIVCDVRDDVHTEASGSSLEPQKMEVCVCVYYIRSTAEHTS